MRGIWLCALVALITLQAGCGFQLRGTRNFDANFDTVLIVGGEAPSLRPVLSSQLALVGITATTDPARADATINLGREQHDQRTLSVDPDTARVREILIGYRVSFSVLNQSNELVGKSQQIDITRDYTFDETAVLSKVEEGQALRAELLRDAADTIVRRLEALQLAGKP